jgi:hypothetical protein
VVADVFIFLLNLVLDALTALVNEVLVNLVTALDVKFVNNSIASMEVVKLQGAILLVLRFSKLFHKFGKLFGLFRLE